MINFDDNSFIYDDFKNGVSFNNYEYFGAHYIDSNDLRGVMFRVWAPDALNVCVVGDFNGWNGEAYSMEFSDKTNTWSLFVPSLMPKNLYKYDITTKTGEKILKSDPYAFYSELRPASASIIYELGKYKWSDNEWIKSKEEYNPYKSPMLIYELHLGSFKRKDDGSFLNYRELATKIADYAYSMGYTHIELLPVAEHPFDASWGYQITGYYSVTSRYGTPDDFMYFVDYCHSKGIGIILDWVPAHFCKDSHGLCKFDGSSLYENSNPLKAEHLEWGTLNFDFEKPEVWSFLISNAFFWFSIYHIDGLRVDAVASMLYLNYCKNDEEWLPNKYGGNENLEAVSFLKKLNEIIFKNFPTALMIAEESTTWPMVTKPTYIGGLGFNFKWNMGWMNDILKYLQLDPIHRKFHHNELTFSFTYAFSENYILPISHDEVVHGKKSLIDKMSGDYAQKFAGLRGFYAYMIAHPGKKLIFMGGEFGQFIEWREYEQLEWFLIDYEMHRKLRDYTAKLNKFYLSHKELYDMDCKPEGLDFIDGNDFTNSVITFMRKSENNSDYIIIISNFTPISRENYRIGVPEDATYEEVFNSDLDEYGGLDIKNEEPIQSEPIKWHNKDYSIEVKLPPLGTIYLKKIDININGRCSNEA